MGQSVSALKDAAEKENKQVKAEVSEQLKFLETAAETRALLKLQELLHGSEGDLQIHGGTVVEQHTRVKIDVSKDESQLEEAIDDLFGRNLFAGTKNIIKLSAQTILGNGAIGECEQKDFELLWIFHSLVRVDFYYWRYNFSANGAIGEVENVFAYVVVKRVFDWRKIAKISLVFKYCLCRMGMITPKERICVQKKKAEKCLEAIQRKVSTVQIEPNLRILMNIYMAYREGNPHVVSHLR